MSNCGNCSQPVSNPSATALKCDGCRLFIHLACIGLTSDDSQRITRNKSKCIKIFCNSCNSADLKSLLSALAARIEALETTIKTSVGAAVAQSIEPKLMEEVVAEAKERIRRSRNVIIRGLREQTGSAAQRKEADFAAVSNIIGLINEGGPSIEPLSVIRLGRVERARGPRPVRVVFTHEGDARRVLRNKAKILGKDGMNDVKLQDDKTPQEIRYLENLRSELDRRRQSGEDNITIRYLKHVPTIVERSSVSKKE